MDIIRGDELAQRFEEAIQRASADERIIISHAGNQVALVSFDDLTFLEEVDRELDQKDLAEVKRRLGDPTEMPIPFVPTTPPQPTVQS
jgi:hypothetical protein